MNTSDSIFKDFANLYPVQKTLRFKLIPQGKTLEHIEREGFLERDKERYEAAEKVKGFAKEMLTSANERILERVNVSGWGELGALINGDSDKKALKTGKENQRKAIFEVFTEDEVVGPILDKKEVKKFMAELTQWMIEQGYTDDGLKAVTCFNGITTYFDTFFSNVKNMYLKNGESTSVFTRAVDENFKFYCANIKKIKEVRRQILDCEGVCGSLDQVSYSENYNGFLSPNGITRYNEEIGKINSFLNEQYQQKKLTKRVKLHELYKQILCEGESSFPSIERIEDDAQLCASIKKMKESLEQGNDNLFKKCESCFEFLEQEAEIINIETKELGNLSKVLFGNWHDLRSMLDQCAASKIGSFEGKKEKEIQKWVDGSAKQISLTNILECLDACGDWDSARPLKFGDFAEKINKEFKTILDEIETSYSEIEKVVFKYEASQEKNLLFAFEDIEVIKNYLDSIKLLERFVKIFDNGMIEKDESEFYSGLKDILSWFFDFDKKYNQIRNYVTQKPFSKEKISLKFDSGTLLAGWDKNKENDNLGIILRKNGLYYLGVLNKNNKPKINFDNLIQDCSRDDCYQKMTYKQVSGVARMLTHVFINPSCIKDNKVPEDILRIKNSKSYSDSAEDLSKYIQFYIAAIRKHDWIETFNYHFKDAHEYKTFKEFCDDIERQSYNVRFDDIDAKEIDSLVEEGKLYLFQIYNKDFSSYSIGAKNLHTLYWEQLFSESSAAGDFPIKLNGRAAIYFRKASIERPFVHESGSLLVNKTYIDEDGVCQSIPGEVYSEVVNVLNSKVKIENVSSEARGLLEGGRLEKKEAPHEIVKDRRYSVDQFQFHVPITLNRKSANLSARELNQRVLNLAKISKDVTYLGIDRGERHLLYLSLIDRNGNIKLQKTLNLVDSIVGDKKLKVDYRTKLDAKEKERDAARKSWKSINNIKDLKAGYLSQVVHEISSLAIENNSIIVMENLNKGFKRGRIKVEKQVYQKFEKQLIDKLSYLAFKPGEDLDESNIGGICKGFQLVPEFKSFEKLNLQHGIIFYVRPWNTSHVDPSTGFMNLFRFPSKTKKFWREFFASMQSISYDAESDLFCFEFKYSDFDNSYVQCVDYVDEWRAYSFGDRLFNYKNAAGVFEPKSLNLTCEIKELFEDEGIEFSDGDNLLPQIQEMDKIDRLGWLFRRMIELRNSRVGTDEDYILSPVLNSDSSFFDSRLSSDVEEGGVIMPIDADANGAYHIALKGLQLVESLEENDGVLKVPALKNSDWVNWIQRFHMS